MDPSARNPSPSPSRQTLQSSVDARNSAAELVEVGGFYEIDHEQLLPKSPIHLKDIRLVKVREKTGLNITVSFPSAFSLRKYFEEMRLPVGPRTTSAPRQPELDEQFVMGLNHACRILRRLVPFSEVEEMMHLECFWLMVPKTRECQPLHLTAVKDEEDIEEGGVAPGDSCLLALKRAGKIGWGVRRKVEYTGRHREESSSLLATVKEERMVEGCGSVGRKRIRDVSGQKKKEDRRIKKLKLDRERASYRKVFKAPKDRWSSERYEAAQLNLLDIMKVKGAVLGNPILRPELREDARKHIGDTGLLDHLLKHMAGKVVSEGKERFRRRHNPEGAMEYWLEPAELQDIRKSAGIMDPFWVPPQGWKPGEPISKYGDQRRKEIEHVKEELASLSRDVDWLRSLKLKENEVQEAQSGSPIIFKLEESCESLTKSNAKLEEQLAAMATWMMGMQVQEDMRLLKLDIEKEEVEREEKEETSREVITDDGRDDGKASKTTAKGTRANTDNVNNSDSSGSTMVRRSGFRICKPQGTFLWPNMGSGAGTCSGPNPSASSGNNSGSMVSSPSVAVPAEDASGVPPTPHWASSATSPPKQLVLPSPVSPGAEPRAQAVVVPRPHHHQVLHSGERTDSSDNTCFPSLSGHMHASGFTPYGKNKETWESDERSGVRSTISTDLALSSPSGLS